MPKENTMLAPECQLGVDARAYWRKITKTDPTYMRLTGDGYIAFGWREKLPGHTSSEHFVDSDGTKFDAGENRVSIYTVLDNQTADRLEAQAEEIARLRAERDKLQMAICTSGAEACGILRSYHEQDGTRLWKALRAALQEEKK